MSDYEQLQYIIKVLTGFEIAFFSLAVICLIVSVIIFIKLKIPYTISLLSGKKKQKQLAEMKAEKELSIQNTNNSFDGNIIKNVEVDNSHKPHSDTISKSEIKISKRHETVLDSRKRQTVVQKEKQISRSEKKQHQTVVMQRKDKEVKSYKTLDEKIFINSDEFIE